MTRQALVVRGGWDGHSPVEATELFIPHLEANGFTVRVEDLGTEFGGSSTATPKIYTDADYLATVDLIVQSNTMNAIEADEFAGLRNAIENGTGFAGWHGGIVDSYRTNSDYLQLVGGQFVKHPAKAPGDIRGDGRDSFVTHTIEITDLGREHEITRGIDDVELETEQYWVLHDDLNDVLATTTHPAREDQEWHRPITSPAVWTRLWGAGRVFVATPGHDVAVLREPSVRMIVERGLLWASRGD